MKFVALFLMSILVSAAWAGESTVPQMEAKFYNFTSGPLPIIQVTGRALKYSLEIPGTMPDSHEIVISRVKIPSTGPDIQGLFDLPATDICHLASCTSFYPGKTYYDWNVLAYFSGFNNDPNNILNSSMLLFSSVNGGSQSKLPAKITLLEVQETSLPVVVSDGSDLATFTKMLNSKGTKTWASIDILANPNADPYLPLLSIEISFNDYPNYSTKFLVKHRFEFLPFGADQLDQVYVSAKVTAIASGPDQSGTWQTTYTSIWSTAQTISIRNLNQYIATLKPALDANYK